MSNKISGSTKMVLVLVVVIAIVIPIALSAVLINGPLPLPAKAAPATSTSSTSVTGPTVYLPAGIGSNQQLNFSPVTLTVAPGTTITFVDQDSAVHDIDFMTGPAGATLPSTSPNLKQGDTFSVTLTVPGTYTYICDYHAWMKASITVTG
ncbi:MAG: plastocyanin/azurin family copper-binding protein [Thaumarchaeota archaeon]|nr:plastocyanin/azurin family copper-binding protein [Nitrososphaerota archaeon]